MIWRVRDRATFDALRRSRRRGRSGPITVTWAPAPAGDRPAEPPKIALAVGRKFANAVVRNRMRRRLRAAARELAGRGALAPGAYLIGAAAEARAMSFAEVCHAVAAAAAEATQRADAR